MPRDKSSGKEIVNALLQASGKEGTEAEDLAERVLQNQAQPAANEFIDIFVIITLHGEPFVTSFSCFIHTNIEELWSSIVGYITVEIDWACQDRGLEPDYKSLAAPVFFRIQPVEGRLERMHQQEQYERILSDSEYRSTPFAFFGSTPDPAAVALLQERYDAVFPELPLEISHPGDL